MGRLLHVRKEDAGMSPQIADPCGRPALGRTDDEQVGLDAASGHFAPFGVAN